jgi:crotonobetainyl-CoA:carnitine CoA-transferase CaiB-like acyl-CoA transferase
VPLFDAMFECIGGFLSNRAVGRITRPGGPLRLPGGETLPCKDGGYMNGVPYARQLLWLVEAAGFADAWRAEGILDFAAAARDPALNALLHERYRGMLLTKTSEEWESIAIRVGLVLSKVRSSRHWLLENEHALQSGSIVEVDDPILGRTRMPGLAVHLDGTPGDAARPRRLPDADRDAVRRDVAGRPAFTTGTATQSARPLEGVRVLDSSQVVAGPICGRILADFGADVIKLNNPKGTQGGAAGPLNRGKRSILLDLQAEDGREVAWELICSSDVLLQNLAKGAMERYGFGYAAVRARKPDLIYASLNAYALNGAWGGRRGHENQGQTATGMMERYGDSGTPLMQPYLVNDGGTGILGAFAIILGLFHRLRTGEGQHVRASLTQTASFHQGLYLQAYAGKVWEEPRGLNARGWSMFQRLYQASDGWFYLGGRAEEPSGLLRVKGLEDLTAVDESRLEERFATSGCAAWVDALNATGFGAHVWTPLAKAVYQPYLRERNLVYEETQTDGSQVVLSGPVPRLSLTPLSPGHRAPQPGADAAEILSEVNMRERLASLCASGTLRLPDGQ